MYGIVALFDFLSGKTLEHIGLQTDKQTETSTRKLSLNSGYN